MYAEIDMEPVAIFEYSTPTYSFQLVDHLGAHVPLSVLTSATLTYYDVPSLTVINSRNHQDILNANNVSITADGLLTWDLQSADTTRIAAATGLVTHEAVFTFIYPDSGTTRQRTHKAWFFITPAALVAAPA